MLNTTTRIVIRLEYIIKQSEISYDEIKVKNNYF